MSLRDEPAEVVVCVAEGRAVVFGTPSGTKQSRWGRWIADLTSSEWASLARTLDPAARAFIEARRLTGHLVEVDQVSRKMMQAGKVIVEEGGWIQSSIRSSRGQVTRLMRIRPASGVAAMSGGAAVLGAIAAQAQAAEMARDIKAIRLRLDEFYGHLKSGHIGAVENAVEQVEDLVVRLRTHGERGVEASDFSVIRNGLGDVTRKCLHHLQDAVTRLEDAGQRTLRQAKKGLSEEAVEEVMLHLELMAKCYAATVQFGFAQIAFDYHGGKPDVARTRATQVTKSISGLRVEIEETHGRLGRLDADIRARFRTPPTSMNLLSSVSAVITTTTSAAVKELTGRSVSLGRIRGIPVSLPAASVAIGAGALLLGGLEAVTHPHAEEKLEERLGQLSTASDRSSRNIRQAAPDLEVLRALPDELAGPDT